VAAENTGPWWPGKGFNRAQMQSDSVSNAKFNYCQLAKCEFGVEAEKGIAVAEYVFLIAEKCCLRNCQGVFT
jgi:hypothetical protein